MAYSHFGRITKQWWGVTHFRIGSRNQPRPNKGFRASQLQTIGSALEYCRWWKRLRRGNLASILNKQAPNDGASNIVTSTYLSEVEKGNASLNNEQLNVLGTYLGVSFVKNKRRCFKRI
ncbi:hypothetical protein BgAZ_109310 [Babesia gibsoni]|uniref:Uncharacterized protein n=1 Tax=Babesia gibsoni TaxID=33632 RepID=A0AAD8PGX1_BABGI|nr:hypothetical protein BgAZ_109310 [Babesia gibsoni]